MSLSKWPETLESQGKQARIMPLRSIHLGNPGYEDYAALEQILGQGLVDRETQTIRHIMFEESMKEELIQALMAQCPEISTSLEASSAEDETAEDEADVNDDGDDEP